MARPHILVMTATPIPRSLCLTAFGDLDLTTIRDLPPGRQRVVTSRVFGAAGRKKAWEFLKKQLSSGRQAYVICPRVEQSPNDATEEVPGSVAAVFEILRAGELQEYRVGLMHGQLAAEEKEAAMTQFRNQEIDILVSTTVVEVGVDVPNATLMVIHQAESFGLSQLHQLRGRVARGKYQGYCFLFGSAASETASQRLEVLEQTSDGFRIAEADFELRGPGDVLGLRQSGQTALKYGNLQQDLELVEETRRWATTLVDSSRFDEPDFAPLKLRVLERFGHVSDLPKSG